MNYFEKKADTLALSGIYVMGCRHTLALGFSVIRETNYIGI